MEYRLPKSIVVPSPMYRRCLEFLCWELWEKATSDWFGEDILRSNLAALPVSPTREALKQLEWVFVLPWQVRREAVARKWDRGLDRDVAAWIVALHERSKAERLLRVNTGSALLWVHRLPRRAAKLDAKSKDICDGLVEAYNYCWWRAEFGDDDVGRWIARCVEQNS